MAGNVTKKLNVSPNQRMDKADLDQMQDGIESYLARICQVIGMPLVDSSTNEPWNVGGVLTASAIAASGSDLVIDSGLEVITPSGHIVTLESDYTMSGVVPFGATRAIMAKADAADTEDTASADNRRFWDSGTTSETITNTNTSKHKQMSFVAVATDKTTIATNVAAGYVQVATVTSAGALSSWSYFFPFSDTTELKSMMGILRRIVGTGNTFSGAGSVSIASNTNTLSGTRSSAMACSTCVASGNESANVAANGCQATGKHAANVACDTLTVASGDKSGNFASFGCNATGEESANVATGTGTASARNSGNITSFNCTATDAYATNLGSSSSDATSTNAINLGSNNSKAKANSSSTLGTNYASNSGVGALVLGVYCENVDNNCLCGGYGTATPTDWDNGIDNKNLTWKIHHDTGNAEFAGDILVGCDVDDKSNVKAKILGASGNIRTEGDVRIGGDAANDTSDKVHIIASSGNINTEGSVAVCADASGSGSGKTAQISDAGDVSYLGNLSGKIQTKTATAAFSTLGGISIPTVTWTADTSTIHKLTVTITNSSGVDVDLTEGRDFYFDAPGYNVVSVLVKNGRLGTATNQGLWAVLGQDVDGGDPIIRVRNIAATATVANGETIILEFWMTSIIGITSIT